MASRLCGSNFKRKQLAITLSSFLRSDSQNNQNKEEQTKILNAKNESRILKKVVGFFSLGTWSSNGFTTTTTQMQCTVTQFANTLGVEPIISRRKIVLTV